MITDVQTAQGVVFDIKQYALHDGPGIRTTVFLKGCPLRCWWCHNPESQSLQPENYARLCRLAYHTFQREETVGKRMSVREVMAVVERERLFHDESGGGVTFSGGEPLMQIDFLEALLRAAHQRDLHTCLDTSGFATPDKFDRILPLVDLFLYDLKLMEVDAHRRYTGVSNRSIRRNLQALMRAGKPVIIRFPLIPTLTDTEPNLRLLKHWLQENSRAIERLDLLPYHDIARGKYQRFEKENKMLGVPEPDAERVAEVRAFLKEAGVRVEIGGLG